MCLIVTRPAGTKVDREVLRKGFHANSDGWGIMSPGDGVVTIRKGFALDEFFRAYDSVPEGDPLCVHFRLKTHGEKNLENCHPFPVVEGKYALMHNGIIDLPTIFGEMSDTWHYANFYVDPLLRGGEHVFGSDWLVDVLGASVRSTNKVVVMRHDGQFIIANSKQGYFIDQGVWVSNKNYEWGSRTLVSEGEWEIGTGYSRRYVDGKEVWTPLKSGSSAKAEAADPKALPAPATATAGADDTVVIAAGSAAPASTASGAPSTTIPSASATSAVENASGPASASDYLPSLDPAEVFAELYLTGDVDIEWFENLDEAEIAKVLEEHPDEAASVIASHLRAMREAYGEADDEPADVQSVELDT